MSLTPKWIGAFSLGVCVLVARAGMGTGQAADLVSKGPRTILIIRHAERPPDESGSVHLSTEGKERARTLHQLFEPAADRPNPFPKPDFIFAAKNSKHSHRPLETVTAVAKKLNVPIKSDYASDEAAALAREVLRNPLYENKTILICWHHGTIPELARRLRAADAPTSWKGTVFDRVWQITYDGGKATFRDRPQKQPLRGGNQAGERIRSGALARLGADCFRQLIADLDSLTFAIRQSATKELQALGAQALVQIRLALKENLTLEARRRLEQILSVLVDVPSPETVRTMRGIMALERIGSREAMVVLQALAGGEPGALETEDARAALERVASRFPRDRN